MPAQYNTPTRHSLIIIDETNRPAIIEEYRPYKRLSKLMKRIEDTALMCWAIKDGKKHRRLRRRLRALKGKAR
jgi:hypothetical protein